jgi:hypothetical protein
LAHLEGKLPAFLAGEFQPTDAAERLGLASVCLGKKLFHAEVRLYADAFAAFPAVADDLRAQHRYNAACAAAQAATGQGEDAAKLDESERARLRKQALGWLRADLDAWTKLLENGPPGARVQALMNMEHWQEDADIASIREEAAVAKLPQEERAALTQLWADVASVLKRAAATSTKGARP